MNALQMEKKTNSNVLQPMEQIKLILKNKGNLCDTCPMLKHCPGCKDKIKSRIKYWNLNK